MATNPTFVESPIRIPPQDLPAERALLGALMIKPKGLNEVIDTFRSTDFYSDKHRKIYNAMLALFDSNDPVDVVSMTSKLKELGQLEQVGGATYLAELIDHVPSSGNLKHYARVVQKKSTLRGLIDSADKISQLSYSETEEVDSILDKAEKIIFGLASFSKKTFVDIKDTLADAWDRFDKLHKSDGSLRGIASGFKELDNKLAGFQNSDLIIIAARPSMGKTSLALDIARHVACKEKIPVGIFSLEMSSQQLVDRMIASESRVDAWKLRTGKLSTDEEFSRIRDALDTLSKAPIYIDDEPSNTITRMKAVARRLKSEYGLGLLIVDYLQLMTPRRDSESMVQQITEISRSLKALARELDVPVIALSQLSRAVEQRRGKPRLSDLRDSGSIEQDADVVMFIHREDKYNEETSKKNIAEILIEKHRNGPTGKIELYFDEKRVSFTSVEKGDFGNVSF